MAAELPRARRGGCEDGLCESGLCAARTKQCTCSEWFFGRYSGDKLRLEEDRTRGSERRFRLSGVKAARVKGAGPTWSILV